MAIVRYLDPRNDIAFKKIFGAEKNKDILIHFLNDILAKDIEDVIFLNTVQNPELARKKQSIVDVLCTDKQGVMFIVEMQVAKVQGFEKRAQYYAAKAYGNQLKEGEEYYKLKEVIFLAIVDFMMFPKKKSYKSEHVILDKESYEQDLKDFSFTFIELPKFTETKVEALRSYEEKWCFFFKHSSDSEDMSKLIEDSDLVIKKAYEEILSHNWSDEELLAYEAIAKSNLDAIAREAQVRYEGEQKGRADGIVIGEQKGREEGIVIGEQKGREEGIVIGEQKGREEGIVIGEQKGREEGIVIGEQKGRVDGHEEEKIEVAKRLLTNGTDISIIILATNLTEDVILKIKNNL